MVNNIKGAQAVNIDMIDIVKKMNEIEDVSVRSKAYEMSLIEKYVEMLECCRQRDVALSAAQHKNDELVKQIDQLQLSLAEISEIEAELEAVAEKTKALAKENEVLATEKRAVVAEGEKIKAHFDALGVELAACYQEIFESSRYIGSLSRERSENASRINELMGHLNYKVEQLTSAERLGEEREKYVKSLEHQLQEKSKAIEDLNFHLQHKVTEVSSTQERASHYQAEIQALKRQVETLSGENIELRKTLRSASEKDEGANDAAAQPGSNMGDAQDSKNSTPAGKFFGVFK